MEELSLLVMVAISFSNAWKWKVKGKSLSRVWLLATPWTTAYQAPPSLGFSRQEYWSRVPLATRWTQMKTKRVITTTLSEWLTTTTTTTKADSKRCWKRSGKTGRNVKGYSHPGKQFGIFLQNWISNYHMTSKYTPRHLSRRNERAR